MFHISLCQRHERRVKGSWHVIVLLEGYWHFSAPQPPSEAHPDRQTCDSMTPKQARHIWLIEPLVAFLCLYLVARDSELVRVFKLCCLTKRSQLLKLCLHVVSVSKRQKKRQKSYTPQYQFIEALQLCPRRLTTPYLTRLGTKYGYGINVEVPEEKCTITASTCPIPKLDDGPKGLLPLPPVLLSSV